jgi:hypothetical protein
METGTYAAVALLKDRQGQATSKAVRFECVPSASQGSEILISEDSL